jgi:hypothetical protein
MSWQAQTASTSATVAPLEPATYAPPASASEPVRPSSVVIAQAPVSDELETILQAIEADVLRRQVTTELLRAARQLLTDCRDAARTGDVASALASARHLEHSIPALLDHRGFR